jgi:hypothetical protein
VTARQLSPAELEQRREAAVSHGGYRDRLTRFAWGPSYANMREQFSRAVGRPTTLRERELLQELAARLHQIDGVQAFLEAQPDPLFRDRSAGVLHPVVAQLDDWMTAVGRLRERLWDLAGVEVEPLGLARRR